MKKTTKIFILVFTVLFVSCAILIVLRFSNKNKGDVYLNNSDDILLQYFDATMPDTTVEFTHSIMNSEDFDRITPLGNINPPAHTFPTDHIYFVLKNLECPVYAPADGKILFIEEPGMYGDRAIRVAITNSMTYYIGHILINENLNVGDTIFAGEEIGINGNTSSVDFGLLNKNIDNGLLSLKIPLTTIYGDKPLSYYCEPATHSTLRVGKAGSNFRRP